ncbi:RNA polymerase sigma factor [Mucilaginibacter sp. SP1R1]|uniref:RNA polymerase sigma factor n=1 Tax=Mucilaginibacter sp. SP1R1 TaxID=2723091 RepID=UPI00162207CE|nr:sigma-70 family RNA polymerase sigma factor [Mucilaginibacter sp. SP1R1]MBB6148154.1 RNA polymerase sigma factor (sigma-70 family) [Mucilaginibacter sp. SP1R1]
MEGPNLHKITWLEFKSGSEKALHNLYKQHYLGLINYGIKFSGNRQYSNDCIVEMLLGLWEKRAKLPEVENVRSYLLTCLRTIMLQHIRSDKLRGVKESHAHSLIDHQELSYEEHITKIQTDLIIKDKLTKSLNKLTERQKELLQLKFFDNLDYDEIASRCNISKRTAYNIVYDALKILKDDLKKEGNEDSYYLLSVVSLLLFAMGANIS